MNKQLELLEKLSKNDSLDTIQKYIKDVIEIRGFSNHSVEQEFLLFLLQYVMH